MNFWKSKFFAFVHDPPTKPFKIQEHEEISKEIIQHAGYEYVEARVLFDKITDHIAASADRLIFPKPRVLHADFKGNEDSPYYHTLGGGKLIFQNPINPEIAEDDVIKVQPIYDLNGIDDKDFNGFEKRIGKEWANFFLHWRLWKKFISEKHPSLAFMPADTRIPDHTIWTHCSITSALQGCVEKIDEADTKINPAFLLFQIGPVQEFIAQARKTKDLWSGSYLLSYLIAHAIKALTDRLGPDAVIFPALYGQPLFDWLHMDELYNKIKTKDNKSLWDTEFDYPLGLILTPNFPNRFLALIPDDKAEVLSQSIEKELQNKLEEISKYCVEYLTKEKGIEWNDNIQKRWNDQIEDFLFISWQVYPWEKDVNKAIALFKQLPASDSAKDLDDVYQCALNIPKEDRDPRNYKYDNEGHPIIENIGFCWSAHYAMTDFLHEGRRNIRDFKFFGDPNSNEFRSRFGVPKDMYSGKEECIGDENWQKSLHDKIKHTFKEGERLGAINIIKRIWDEAYLKKTYKNANLSFKPKIFESVPDVAANSWVKEVLLKQLDKDHDINKYCNDFVQSLQKAYENGEIEEIKIDEKKFQSPEEFLKEYPSFCFTSELRRLKEEYKEDRYKDKNPTSRKRENSENALRHLKTLQKRLNSEPTPYIAILAMDGDSMGKWLSGEKSPCFHTQLSKEAKEYFNNQQLLELQQILKTKRPLFPSYHIELSSALANFSLYLAPSIVHQHYGQLIYSGGDDILAMLPAEKALQCAYVLRKAFRGDPTLSESFYGALKAPPHQWGFVSIDGKWEGWKEMWKCESVDKFLPQGYPLLLMGKNADISAGIAIGHIHSPLQNLVEEAKNALEIAKSSGYGKSAFVVNLFKRSGEIAQWGSKWNHSKEEEKETSFPLEILNELQELYENNRISGKLPYRIAELVSCYFQYGNDELNEQVKEIIKNDIRFAVDQHFSVKEEKTNDSKGKEILIKVLSNYLDHCTKLHDFLGPLITFAFFKTKGAIG
ncbi:type III-B CRISPR-associated protein Cas10/Cmr2 [Candidatus Methylacidiphilum fumarolicum]|uniref:Uncharacterized protein n=2 Tax=Candidatus Methylacidiphilum fumarolicum TaxID=591154 RepID=I0JYZ6_METFB|nr:type III-B CRISPR-associated protein Cas10/Cmr2 [Candidatus Methylacidiphilum fumarolicum]MBW6414634.1 type III-B CRISPR-associated protein Cas10/Cmr2 [Candidatus Methylacidiphilum fumarolicum]TFE65654.1 type III-B CRISPR-associated protein Cas10/Cmr2 [Candidatus Methylacidiphilum fumarolicum]TFE74207.1 type III-B CRISPR-associated protein Cas10/Cmr2 [Candidatus Methylacidiphilum fumarolicum]TFE75706.1 type III-B CRISPR-associated protein Cas10/Cmr2 [Candidatus Methylacidiphilum fumarolicum]